MTSSSRIARLILLGISLVLAGSLAAQVATDAAPDADARETSDSVPPEWIEGRGENELVLIHGLGANSSIWDEVVPYLAGSFDIRRYELHGHGQTAPLPNPSITAEAEALRTWIEAEGLIYPTIVGHGMGGMIAMQYTFDHPADVQRLIVIDAGPRQLASDAQKADVAQALLDDYDRFVASFYTTISPDEEVNELAVDMALRTDSATFASMLLSSFEWDLSARLPNQSVPMLVIGSESYLPEVGYEQEYLEQYGYGAARGLSYKRVDHSGHYLMLEQPTMLSSIIAVYIRQEELD